MITSRGAQNEQKNLVNLFKGRAAQLSSLDERYWTIIGYGSIGAKAEELRAKTWAIEAAGFTPNPRVVLAMGFFEEFRKRNGIDRALSRGASSLELTELVSDTPFQEPELRAIRHLVKLFRRDFPGVPLVVRSSAHGDCRGTGIYESDFCPHFRDEQKTIGGLMRTVKEVLTSEFSESAIAFRRDLDLPNGMAVIIEPVFGQFVKAQGRYADKPEVIFGPFYSGVAYTSTSGGPGYVQFVAGLPTRAVQGEGFIARERDENSETSDFFNHRALLDSMYGDERKARMNFGTIHRWRNGEWLKNGRLIYDMCARGRCDIRAKKLFQMLRKMEHLIGKPQYVEWAVRKRIGCDPEFAILQIADLNPKTDYFELVESERTLVTSNFVSGSGQLECNGVVGVYNPNDIYLLREYNHTHANYAVIFSGRLVSRSWNRERLRYGDLYNASALIEIADTTHVGSPAAHFGGMADLTGKLLMATRNMRWELFKRYETRIKDGDLELHVYPIRVRVTASERRQKGIVELIG